ncbi:16S rRNA (guanine(527)-N(7))-methyltransferase RsmG [Blattabacterium cuenoti]|uniref:16S rRNA (guanine(527)-N(7))-methyltransferase RsmG n=1 Tax=Blattabacterium cuenoti TaxID=1653831 RepID=UPI00163C5FD0|nr:16S rRNA (guanine(527)-N(7))-methyltransferase RsmG [Blattabacterium cuenoti]
MDLIKKYFSDLSRIQYNKINNMNQLYKYWNVFVNLISRKTFINNSFYQNHVLLCLSIAKVLKFFHGSTIMDLGTGGGFPGIPLSIIFPNSKFLLVDSIMKKIKIVEKIVTHLNLNNVYPICIRAEKLNMKFDFVVNRGITNINMINNWIKNKFRIKSNHKIQNGSLYLKGGDVTHEIKNFPNAIIYNLHQYFDEPFFKEKKIIWIPNIL